MSNLINARFQLKYDSYQNWKDKNPLLLAGEIAIAKLTTTNAVAPTENDTQAPVLFKVGPGNFNDLPWASALAADVYGWAKAETVDVVDKKLIFKNHDGSEAGSVDFTAFALTAEVAATLEAYYVKTEVDAIVEGINNTIATLATKEELADEVEALEGAIADVDAKFASYYTKTEVDAAHDLKADKTQVATDIETAVNAEKDRAMSAEGNLRTYIDEELAKKQDNIPENTYDVYGAASDVKDYADETFATKVALGEEATARANADQSIRDDMTTALAGKADKTQVEADIAAAVAAEEQRATGVEASLRTDVNAVIARVNAFLDNTGAATEAIDTLQELITYIETHDDVEIADILADIQALQNKTVLGTYVEGEETKEYATVKAYVEAVVAALEQKITAAEGGYADADAALKTELEGKITAEETARTNADTALGQRIDGVVTDLGTEVTNRTNEIARVEGLISTEATNRENADTQIRTDFAAADDVVRGELASVKSELEGKITNGDAATLESANGYTDEKVGALAEGAVADNTAAIAKEVEDRTQAVADAITEVKAYADEAAQAAQAATTYTAGFGIAIDESNVVSIDQSVTFIFCAGDASTIF